MAGKNAWCWKQGRLITDNASLTPLRLKAVNLDASSTFGQLMRLLSEGSNGNVEVDTDKNWLIGILKSKSSSGRLDFLLKVAFQRNCHRCLKLSVYLPALFFK